MATLARSASHESVVDGAPCDSQPRQLIAQTQGLCRVQEHGGWEIASEQAERVGRGATTTSRRSSQDGERLEPRVTGQARPVPTNRTDGIHVVLMIGEDQCDGDARVQEDDGAIIHTGGGRRR